MNTFIVALAYQVNGYGHIGSSYVRTSQDCLSIKMLNDVVSSFDKELFNESGNHVKSVVFSVSSLGFVSDEDWEGV